MDTLALMGDDEVLSNEPIDVGGLPRLVDAVPTSPDPAYLRLKMAGSAVAAVVVLFGAIAAGIVARPIVGIIGGLGALVLVALNAWLRRIEVAHLGFVVRDHDVTLHSGVVSRSTATVPFARVQHVSIERGPLDRRYDLAAVQLRTAGGSITIPGLRNETAVTMKQLVAERAASLAENEVIDSTAPVEIVRHPADPFGQPPTGRPVDDD